MRSPSSARGPALLALALATLLVSIRSHAHGGVVLEEDLCVIKIGYLQGHFKIYLPRARQHTEYCEDLPERGETVFVMEYLHSGLGAMLVDFRIIEDRTGLGRFARWEDVERLGDLEEATVLYRGPTIEPDVLTVVHEFTRDGDFIGIVTAVDPATSRRYVSVFPFEVGFTGFGAHWQWFVGLLALVQLNYWLMTGRLARWYRRASAGMGLR
ncbi:MAG TPA: hypothetical protein VLD39_15075 [Gammaproteobacteria bacterium]|nr:hypothetical protein [Gammaproteobacteria bacterium]